MEHTKETLSALVREMQSVTACNRGVYILNIEIFLDKYSNKILRAGAFFYILVEAGTAEFVVDCHSYNVGKGDMLLVAPRMSVELMKKVPTSVHVVYVWSLSFLTPFHRKLCIQTAL